MKDSALLDAVLEFMKHRTIEDIGSRIVPRENRVTYENIGNATGIKPSWLKSLMKGRCKDPGVIKIERLYRYFTKKDLPLAD